MDAVTREPVTARTRARRLTLGRAVMALLCLLLVGGIVYAAWFWHPAAPGQSARSGIRNAPVPVLVAASETRDVPVYLDGLGTVQAFNSVTVKAMVDGPLVEVRFKEGQDVRAGDVLARIDPRTYQAMLDQAVAKKAQDQANLANARLDLVRYQKLAATAYTSAQQADTQKATVAQLEAQVQGDQAAIDNARTQLGYTTVTAPINGRTGVRLVDQGNIVHASDATGMVVITTLQPISVVFTLPQQELPAVAAAMKDGSPEAFAVAQGSDGAHAGVLDRGVLAVLDNQVDPTTGTIKLKATFPNAELKLWPGGFVDVRLKVATEHDAIVVPPAAVQRGPAGAYVYVVGDGDAVHRQPVTVGHEDERESVITSGLPAGARVVTDGAARLTDGAHVSIVLAGRGGGLARPGAGQRSWYGDAPASSTAVNISAPFIARPIATWLLAIAILLAGVLGYRSLPVSALPQVDFPTIQITTQLPGASPETVSTLITASLERQFGQIPGLVSMTSQSSEGTSQITLQFDLNRSMDSAAQDVQAAINAAAGTLPNNLPYPPVYAKVNPADAAILTLALTSDSVPIDRVSDAADTLLQPKLSEIDGVGKVTVQGNLRPAVRVRVDPARLAAYGLSMEDVRTAVANANSNGPKGGFDGPRQAYAVGANDQLVSADAYKDLVLAWRNNAPVRLSNIGSAVPGVENDRVEGWYDGKPAAVLDIQRQPGANIVQTVARVRAALPKLERGMPAGVVLTIVADRTETIRASVADVQWTLALSIVLVVGVIFVFLRSARATFIPAVALPLSLVGTFGVMSLLGYGLDNLSLMALTVATGFVVDDAIVMIENITRHIEEGVAPLRAAFLGAGEIGFTIVSLTVSLIAVFIPLLFMTGVIGRLFNEFSVTLSVAVIVSAIVSLTLTPMMCGRLLRPAAEAKPGLVARWSERGFDGLLAGYKLTLRWALGRQSLLLLIAVATLIGTIALYIVVPKGFLPQQDTGVIVATTEASESVSIPRLAAMQARAADIVARDPAVSGVVSFVGAGTINATPNTGRLTIALKPVAGRDPAPAVIERLGAAVAGIPGLSVFFQPVQDIQIGARVSRTQFQYTLMDTDPAELAIWAPKLLDRLRSDPVLRNVASDQQDGGFRTYLRLDRAAAMRLGVSMQAVQDTLYDAFGQRQISTIFGQANQYRVVLEADPSWQADPNRLMQLRVPGANDAQVPLSGIATIERTTAPLVVTHQAQFPSVTLSFDLAPGYSLGQAVTAVHEAERAIGMPNTVTGGYSGDAAEFQRSLAAEPWLIGAAMVVIYIVLGVLYESVIHPITILSTLPSAGIGALLALMLCGADLSLVALVGVVLLMGIVKKNAIMMIDFALDAERERGLTPRAAIEEASLLRFRPIMMTTMAALLGAVPLVIGHGAGSELRAPLGITIIGGLLLSQLLTLYTTPVIYLYMERLRRRVAGSAVVAAE